ncbi:histone-lysine N-methyltransferase set-26 isoform X1 [Rhopalosiphum padi]|uniref:histone-lysine N-methyltransferase set-26 isoform X1 n=1 Tax=Rhopalosiphum padi TaxID=40932 RepID=UPI00298E383D|nr:histone-lysine N-methyltransferase set-26 isoform X1 [Rhopalosiphum padi]XP_060841670.1 histone-lysine N-methyltransferase set-26 isoform X1 [Rhopalosiphum padi]
MESDGNVRTPGSAAYFLVGSSRVPCGPAVSGQLTIPVGRPVSNQDVSGPSLIVQMTPSRSQTQDHHARATVVRTANQPVTMHRFPLQLNHASANHILSPNQHFKQIPVYQRNASSIQMESVRKNVFVSTQVASPQLPYSRVGLTPHMLMTYMPPRNRQSNNQRSRVVPVNRPNPMLRRDHCPSDDELLEVTEHRPVYDAKKPAELIKVEHNYCFVPRVSPQRANQINGLTSTINVTSGQSCIVSPTVSQIQPQTQYNVVNNNNNNNNKVIQKSVSIPNNVPISTSESLQSLQSLVKHEPQVQVESELSASDHDLDGQGEETDTAPEAVAECKDNNIKSEEPAITRCICEMEHDDGFMISCDKCLVWQHVDCVLESRNNLPEEYLCERCSPRPFNKEAAAALQHMKLAKRIAMASASHLPHSSDSDLSSELDMPIERTNIQNKRKKYKSRQKNTPKRKPNGLSSSQIKQRRKSGPSPGPRKKGSMTPEKKALAEERKKMLIKRKEMLLEKKRLAAMDKKKKVNQEKKIIQKKKTIDYSSDDEPKLFKADKQNKPHTKSNSEQPVDQLRNWIDKYEEAVTNHYSQELRARLSAIKPNGSVTTGELRTPVKIPISRTKMSLLPSGIKMLVSSSVLTNNQPIVEVRGKFTWTGSLAYKDPIPNRTDPYVFFYVVRFSTDCDIEVCVDCRTYGNDARFVRRSCKPNAELKHYIEKGSIHLYIVANRYIEKNTEITINHQAAVPFKRCNCGDPSTCTASISPIPNITTPPLPIVPKSSSSSPLIDPTVSNSSDDENKPQRNKRTRQQRNMKKPNKKIVKRTLPKVETPPPPPPPPLPSLLPHPLTPVKSKEPNGPGRPKSPIKKVETSPEPDLKSNNNDNKLAKRMNEMSREERKMVAIMKAFERMEKKEARKQESRSHKDSDTFNNSSPHNLNRNRVRKSVVKRKQRPSNKNSRSKSTRTNRPQRRAATISSRTYNSSSDEDDNNNDDDDEEEDRKGRLLSKKRVQNRCKFSVRFQHRPSALSSIPRSMLRRSPHSSLLNTPSKMDSEEASGSEGTPPAPLSNTCMLVAAAVGPLAPGFKFPNTKKDFVNSWVKSEGNSPTGSEDFKLGESGCAKKRWLQQAISEQDSVGISNGDQQVGPLKKRRMARESMSDCPSPTVPGSGHMNFADDDVIEDEEVEQASRNIASIDSKLAIFENKNIPLIDLQKSSNTVALVESFLGEFKPDDEGATELVTQDKSHVKIEVDIKNEAVDDPQPTQETLVNKTISIKHENKVSNEVTDQPDNSDVHSPDNKPNDTSKETIEECVMPVIEQPPSSPPPPPPPPPPVKRKLSLSEYRRRKESQATVTKEKDVETGASDTRPSPSVSPNTTLAAYEEITQQVIAKSLELESKLALQSSPSLFETTISKEEPKQWENLNDRLRRQFGVNITEDLPKRHPRLSPPPEFIPTPIETSRYSYYHHSDEQLYSCAKEDLLLPSAAVHDNGPPKLFSPPSQAYFSTMFFRQPPPPPPPPPPPV